MNLRPIGIVATAFILFALPAVSQDVLLEIDPLLDVAVGERCEYGWKTEVGLKKLFRVADGVETRTVRAVGETEVEVEVAKGDTTERKVLDRRLAFGKSLVAALPDFDLLIGDAGKLSDLSLEKSRVETESIEAAGARYECRKVTYHYAGRYEFTVNEKPHDVEAVVEYTTWVDPTVPIQGIVQRQVTIRAKSLPFDPEVLRWTSTLSAASR